MQRWRWMACTAMYSPACWWLPRLLVVLLSGYHGGEGSSGSGEAAVVMASCWSAALLDEEVERIGSGGVADGAWHKARCRRTQLAA